MADRTPLDELTDAGVAVWLDDLSRNRLASGGLAALARDSAVVGVTTNPSIFEKAIGEGGSAYDVQLADLALRGVSVDQALWALTTADVRSACDVLRPVYDRTSGLDGRVSIEVDPRLAHDTARTIAEARALWWQVDRPNLFIKIPATVAGLPAITACLAEGISVNVTLIFSLDRYNGVTDAWLTGLEQAAAAGLDLAGIASVASFFVSRVDTEIDKRLDSIGTDAAAALRGQAAIAGARLAFGLHTATLAGPRWAALRDQGATPQRPLWASTGVKDPAYPDTLYVVELVAPGTVNTMPEATLDAVRDHGVIRPDAITGTDSISHAVLDGLERLGVSYAAVTDLLEREGVTKFVDAWEALSTTVAGKLGEASVAAPSPAAPSPAAP